jgi:hypothetical protein
MFDHFSQNHIAPATKTNGDRVGTIHSSSPISNQVDILTQELPYFELAGYKLEKQNHGKPQCPDIKINEKNASQTKPQAWSKEIEGTIHWVYNFP